MAQDKIERILNLDKQNSEVISVVAMLAQALWHEARTQRKGISASYHTVNEDQPVVGLPDLKIRSGWDENFDDPKDVDNRSQPFIYPSDDDAKVVETGDTFEYKDRKVTLLGHDGAVYALVDKPAKPGDKAENKPPEVELMIEIKVGKTRFYVGDDERVYVERTKGEYVLATNVEAVPIDALPVKIASHELFDLADLFLISQGAQAAKTETKKVEFGGSFDYNGKTAKFLGPSEFGDYALLELPVSQGTKRESLTISQADLRKKFESFKVAGITYYANPENGKVYREKATKGEFESVPTMLAVKASALEKLGLELPDMILPPPPLPQQRIQLEPGWNTIQHKHKVQGRDIEVVAPLRDFRQYKVNGKEYLFEREGQWYRINNFMDALGVRVPKHGDVKIHLATTSIQDLRDMQAVLIPALLEATKPGGPLEGKLFALKTHDPMHPFDARIAEKVWPNKAADFYLKPGPTGQGAKGFTLYPATEADAQAVHDFCVKTLKDADLCLPKALETGNMADTVADRTTNRVSIERDLYECSKGSKAGAVLPEALAKSIKDYCEKKVREGARGWEQFKAVTDLYDGGQLKPKVLELVLTEHKIDIDICSLTYEVGREGRLIFCSKDGERGSRVHEVGGEPRFYLSETGELVFNKPVVNEQGKVIQGLSGRAAYYELSKGIGKALDRDLDPAKLAMQEAEKKRNLDLQHVRQGRKVPGLYEPLPDRRNATERRQKAKLSGNPLASSEGQQQLLDSLFNKVSGWNIDLTEKWNASHKLREGIQQAYEKALSIARAEARKVTPSGGGIEAKAAELLLKPSESLLKNREFASAHRDWITRSNYYSEKMKETNHELSARQNEIQAQVDKFCEKHGLPKAVLDFKALVDVPGGAYQRGGGVVRLSYEDLLSPRSAALLLNSLTHELGHLFQDKLIIHDIIDGLADKPKAAGTQLSEEQIKKIQLEYRKRTGCMLDASPHFLQEVNRVRAGKDLSTEQKAMAKVYAESFAKSKSIGADFQRSAEHYRATLSEILGLKQTGSATDLIRRLSQAGSESLCEHLFGVKSLELLPESHPAKKHLIELVEKYKKASLDGKIVPLSESDIWSDKKATEALRPVLRDRLKEINEWRKRQAAEYTSSTHEQEASVLGNDVQEKAEQRLKELKLRAPDRQAAPTKGELDLYERVEKEWRKRWGEKPLPAEHSRDFNDCLAAVVDSLDEEGRNREAEALKRISKDYQADEKRGAGERKTVERFNYLAEYTGKKTTATDSRHAERVLALGYDPIPVSSDNLLRLGKEARIEVSRLGIKTVREKYRSELFKETDLTKERLLEIFRDQIKQLEEEYKRTLDEKTKAYLDCIKATEKEIAAKGMTAKLKSILKSAAKGGSEVAGTAIGIGIILTAALGWYIRYVKESDPTKEGLPPLPDFG